MRGVSNIVVGIAIALVVLAVAAAVIPWLRTQANRSAGSIPPSAPTVSVFAFLSKATGKDTTYTVVIYNYGIKDVPAAYILYNVSGNLYVYQVGPVKSGGMTVVDVSGVPVTYFDNLGNVVRVRVVNVG